MSLAEHKYRAKKVSKKYRATQKSIEYRISATFFRPVAVAVADLVSSGKIRYFGSSQTIIFRPQKWSKTARNAIKLDKNFGRIFIPFTYPSLLGSE